MTTVRNRTGERLAELEPITVRVGDAARITGLCRSKIFRLIASGDIEAVNIGKVRVVFIDSLKQFLRARAASQKQERGHPER
ncbi:MAG: helix-turn-helix domain-containing protein [Sphingopyxis sp.]